MNYELSAAALRDTDNIWQYTLESWGIQQADACIDSLFNFLDLLAQQRFLWRDFPQHATDTKSALYREHVIYFGNKQNAPVIYRILHSSQDPNIQIGGR